MPTHTAESNGLNLRIHNIQLDLCRQAIRWHTLAASRGVAASHYHLGLMKAYGRGFNQDFSGAVIHFQQVHILACSAVQQCVFSLLLACAAMSCRCSCSVCMIIVLVKVHYMLDTLVRAVTVSSSLTNCVLDAGYTGCACCTRAHHRLLLLSMRLLCCTWVRCAYTGMAFLQTTTWLSCGACNTG
jgi:hypothetical protein